MLKNFVRFLKDICLYTLHADHLNICKNQKDKYFYFYNIY